MWHNLTKSISDIGCMPLYSPKQLVVTRGRTRPIFACFSVNVVEKYL